MCNNIPNCSHRSMLNGWLQKADKIRNSRPGSLKSGRSGRRPQFPGIESQLFELLRAQLAKGKHVSNKWIRENARRLAVNAGTDGNSVAPIVADDGTTTAQCQFSERWLNNFKRRFGIQTGPKDGELMLSEGVPLTEECMTETGFSDAVKSVTTPETVPSADDAITEDQHWAKYGINHTQFFVHENIAELDVIFAHRQVVAASYQSKLSLHVFQNMWRANSNVRSREQ